MKKHQEVYIILALLTVIFSSGISTAYANSSEYEEYRKGKSTINEKRQDVLMSFENKNYQEWLSAVGRKNPLAKLINEDEFNKFVSARDLARAGQYDASLEIGKEVGVELEKSIWQKISVPRIVSLDENKPAALIPISQTKTAPVWLELASNFSAVSQKMTEDNFYLLVQADELKKEGRFEEAKAIEKELGIA